MAADAGTWSRLALIQAASEGDTVLENVAAHWGYQRQVIASERSDKRDAGESALGDNDFAASDQTAVENKPKRPPALFPRILSIETLETRREDLQKPAFLSDPSMGLRPEDSPPGTYVFAPPEPLLPARRLLPLLFNALNQTKSAHKLDTRRLVRRIARGQALQKLPRAKRARWPLRLLIIIDTDKKLEPYWADFDYWVKQLQALLGNEAVDAIRFEERSLGEQPSFAMCWPGKVDDAWFVWQLPAVDTTVLIFSDLGQDDSRRALRWQRQLAGLRDHSAPLLALSPAACADGKLWDWLRPNPYNDRTVNSHPSRNGFNLPVAAETDNPPHPVDGAAPLPDWDTILAWLSALPLIDVGLLRLLRRNLNWGDSSLEGLIWNHPHLRHIGVGMRVRETVSERYREIYRQRLAGSGKAKTFWECVAKHHQNAYAGLKHLESLNRCGLEQTDEPAMCDYFLRLCKTAWDEATNPNQQALLRQQCHTILNSLPKTLWRSDLSALLYPIYAAVHSDKIRDGEWPEELEPGFEPERLAWIMGTDDHVWSELVAWNFTQIGSQGELQCRKASDAIAGQPYLFQLVTPKAFPPRLIRGNSLNAVQETLFDHARFSIPYGGIAAIQAGNKRFHINVIPKPSWAIDIALRAIGKSLACLVTKMCWVGHEFNDVEWHVTETLPGRWALPKPFGDDQYGLYADLTVNQVNQRFRWIEPGSFMMGSPEDEPERYDNETQHPVTLTQGFWLADTAVTLAFWLAVLGGDNPSYFKNDPQNPVEQVSWNAAQSFIASLNQRVSGLNAQLPTEAQWEYACRAGTTTPFSFGANITSEQVNYDGGVPYAEGKKGWYRGKTVPVKSLPANPWGLYEMHGNVWEWCQDGWQENLGTEAARDPLTQANEAAGGDRVLRGGSWNDYGRDVRSAIRDRYRPDSRDRSFGFRLALGHAELQPGQVSGAVKPAGGRGVPEPDGDDA